MSEKRITRSQSKINDDLRGELEKYNPFEPTRQIPRGSPEACKSANTSSSERSVSSDPERTIRFQETEILNFDSSSEEDEPHVIKMTTNDDAVAGSRAVLQSNQVVSIKDALRVVPDFDGSNVPFSQFLEGCSEAKEMIEPAAEGNFTKLLRSKICGEARQAISGKTFDTVDSFKNYLKGIYAPAKTVTQLLGELGNEFQNENESVIAYANRMRDLGSRIIEAKKISGNGAVDAAFRASIEENLIECFKRGLKFEIEQRLDPAVNVELLVKNAITIERRLAAQKALRKVKENNNMEIRNKRKTFTCQVCREEGHEANNCRLVNSINIICDYCKMGGHSIDKCFKRSNDKMTEKAQCQICNQQGHTAGYCRRNLICQVCNKPGHSAKQCFQANNGPRANITCQLCNRPGHSADKCYSYKGSPQGRTDPIKARSQLLCQLCERTGHTAATCRVRTEIKCDFCKFKGHTIDACLKRQYSEKLGAGNGQRLPATSATGESAGRIQRQTPVTNTDNILSELIPMN